MKSSSFDVFFQGDARQFLDRAICMALEEDSTDLTSNAIFDTSCQVLGHIVAKEDTLVAGLPMIPLILSKTAILEHGDWQYTPLVDEGSRIPSGTVVAKITSSARILLRAERIILNFVTHLSGVANLVSQYVHALEGTGVRLLDTRKTLPCLRYPEKYAVLVGGGCNHRLNLSEMLMVKDNHTDAAGSITLAVQKLRAAYDPVPPIEVECRTIAEVKEAVSCGVNRIMLDNMPAAMQQEALNIVPPFIETEISGGVTLETIRAMALTHSSRKPDFISVGRLTHSAVSADFSMRIHVDSQ